MPSPFVSPRPTASKPKVLQRRRARDCPQDGAVGARENLGLPGLIRAVARAEGSRDDVGCPVGVDVAGARDAPAEEVAVQRPRVAGRPPQCARSRHLTDFTVRKALPKDADGFVRAHEEAWDATI